MSKETNFIAALKDREYWDDRAKRLFKNAENSERHLIEKLSKYYKEEAEKINKLIAEYYSKYGEENVIQYRELLKKLSDSERILLIEDIDAFLEKYSQYKDLKKIRESIYKLDRLEGLKISIQISMRELAEKEIKDTKELLKEIYKLGFDYASEELGYGKSFNMMDKNAVEKFINKEWINGKNFSWRIHKSKKAIVNWVVSEFADGVKRGDSYEKLIKKLMSEFENFSRNNAKRLVVTEASYILNESSMSVFENEFEDYEFNSILDKKTSDICRALDGRKYKISERKAGVNFPPMHPNCRSSFNIVIPDDWMETIDERQFERFKNSGIDMPEKFEDFLKIKYNDDKDEWEKIQIKYKIRTKYNLEINKESQNRHIEKNKNHKSYLFEGINAQELVEKYAGTGTIKIDPDGFFVGKEIIEIDDIIGVNVDKETKEETKTNKFSIHYSKTGTHVVPRKKE